MTPQQMLKRGVRVTDTSSRQEPTPTDVNVLAPPASQGMRIKMSEAEPWLLEQLHNGACPTCGEHILRMRCSFDPTIEFYTCEDNVTDHRWTITEVR